MVPRRPASLEVTVACIWLLTGARLLWTQVLPERGPLRPYCSEPPFRHKGSGRSKSLG
uniref:Predicted gene, 49395 n=1 Tax=Mus musculus TaxID=10090 RepID=A0A286YCN5_MOUSE